MVEDKVSKVVMVCPECGVDMTNLNPEGHALAHYPDYLDPAKTSKEARNYQKLIRSGGVSKEHYQALHKEG